MHSTARIFFVFFSVISMLGGSSAWAWERGEDGVLCGELPGFMWMGKEHHPCFVTILEVAGSKVRVLTNNHCVGGQYHDRIGSKGSTAWINTYALITNADDCRAAK